MVASTPVTDVPNRAYGVIDGHYYQTNQDRTQDINDRIYQRVLPSATLQPAFNARPLNTKYAYLPVLDLRPQAEVPMLNYGTFNTAKVFNPGNAKAPWRGYAENVNLESSLRNQYFALQKNDLTEYVPASNSDLYVVPVDSRYVPQPNPYLFDNSDTDFNAMNPNPHGLGRLFWANHTRVQLKEAVNNQPASS